MQTRFLRFVMRSTIKRLICSVLFAILFREQLSILYMISFVCALLWVIDKIKGRKINQQMKWDLFLFGFSSIIAVNNTIPFDIETWIQAQKIFAAKISKIMVYSFQRVYIYDISIITWFKNYCLAKGYR